MEKKEDVIFGAIYTAYPKDLAKWSRVNERDPWDQHYGYYIPVTVNKEGEPSAIYMIDTYQVDRSFLPYTRDPQQQYADIVDRMSVKWKEAGELVYYRSLEHYYRSAVRLTDETAQYFTLAAILNEWEPARGNEATEYDKEDIICGVRLYREHNYPTGIILKQKNAEKVPERIVDTAINDILEDIKTPFILSGRVQDLEKMIDEFEKAGKSLNTKKIRIAMRYFWEVERMMHDFETYSEKSFTSEDIATLYDTFGE